MVRVEVVSQSRSDGASGTFVGVATATFPAGASSDAEVDGTITFQWYRKLGSESSFSALGAGSTFYSGETTSTLTISYALSPDQHNSEYYLEAQYTPAGLGVTEKSAGDVIQEPITSGIATLSINPSLSIITQPSDQTAVVDKNATFKVTPGLTDTTQGGLTYQWSLNGSPVSDGNVETTTTLARTTSKVETSGKTDVTIPDDATEVQIEISGAKGSSGSGAGS